MKSIQPMEDMEYETSKFHNKVYFNNDEVDECKKSIPWKMPKPNNTNPRYKHFNQMIYHAGDVADVYRYGMLYAHYFNDDFEHKQSSNSTIPTPPLPSMYQKLSTMTTKHTFHMMFEKYKKGVYVQIKNNKLKVFLPFSNATYTNLWYNALHVNKRDKMYLDEMKAIESKYPKQWDGVATTSANVDDIKRFLELESITKKIFARHCSQMKKQDPKYKRVWNILHDRRKWYSNNCFFRNSYPTWEGDKLVNQYLHMIESLVKERTIPDVEFFLHLRDFPILKNDLTEPYDALHNETTPMPSHFKHAHNTPILGYCGATGFADVPMPTYEDWANQNSVIFPEGCKVVKNHFELVWEKKTPRMIFRGSATGCGINAESNLRIKVHFDSKKNPNYDIGITDWKVRLMKTKQGLVVKKPLDEPIGFLSYNDQSKYCFILHLDGHVGAVRLGTELAMASVVLIPDSKYKLWFQFMLKPWIHYVPLKQDVSDMDEKYNWCLNNMTKCKTIAQNARTFYEQYLSRDYILDFWQATLQQIHQNFIPSRKKNSGSLIHGNNKNNKNNNNNNIDDASVYPAYIIPYRDSPDGKRHTLLKSVVGHLKKMHGSNKSSVSRYHIYIVEQSNDEQKFNRGFLCNIGFLLAKKNNHSHYIFHDGDVIPCFENFQLYNTYPHNPLALGTRGSRYDTLDFHQNVAQKTTSVKSHFTFLGNCCSFNATDFEKINGFPIDFWGWGGEDDELSARCRHHGVVISVPEQGRIIDLENLSLEEKKQELKGKKEMMKWEKLAQHRQERHKKNGLVDVKYSVEKTKKIFDECTKTTVVLSKMS